MARDGADTQTRILDAARTEFAAYGLAGARIDRIARSASASKERMYAYYPDKKALFLAVLDLNLREFASAVVLVNNDLPAFAGALFDHTISHPQHLRMIDWARLETDGTLTASLDVVVGFRDDQVRRIRAAQDAGAVDPAWDPMMLMTVIFGIISAWVHEPGSEARRAPREPEIADRRANVVRAVGRLCRP
ncbi:TetR/AcrR family transcriptional regulator [Cryobacterium frigoriphilum]|uniref:TetR/AcrR family transcriptional regulator n=1 Tax=Cryobacterium frigoriphilum TaxID=1259150 RepID=A0A4R9AAH3_9MICO|nr:TetR family transcriptional regulator [Cryobacterium frigoriphilum]TFD55248.1 TetR/AcrR family transcriptional regulator [Cryobacterium frigoriphilum]